MAKKRKRTGVQGPKRKASKTGEGTALHREARGGDVEAVREILGELAKRMSLDAVVNGVDEHGRTPLMLASYAGNFDVVETLLAAGADTTATAADRTLAVHFAAQKCPRCLKVLLKDVDVPTTAGKTPLHFAATAHNAATVQVLVLAGADVDKANAKGQTPRQIAPQLISDALEMMKQQAPSDDDDVDDKPPPPHESSNALENKSRIETTVEPPPSDEKPLLETTVPDEPPPDDDDAKPPHTAFSQAGDVVVPPSPPSQYSFHTAAHQLDDDDCL